MTEFLFLPTEPVRRSLSFYSPLEPKGWTHPSASYPLAGDFGHLTEPIHSNHSKLESPTPSLEAGEPEAAFESTYLEGLQTTPTKAIDMEELCSLFESILRLDFDGPFNEEHLEATTVKISPVLQEQDQPYMESRAEDVLGDKDMGGLAIENSKDEVNEKWLWASDRNADFTPIRIQIRSWMWTLSST